MSVGREPRYLIVNADDFGRSPGVNRGIAEAHERGIVTSASLMVRWPSAAEAAAYSQRRTSLSLGIHVDLAEWAYREGTWRVVYEVVDLDDARAVADEVDRQLATFRALVGRNPTHVDSHQHIHLDDPVRSALDRVVRKLGVPLRECDPSVRYCGDFYGQTAEGRPLPGVITPEGLLRILADLPSGLTELACHPGIGDDLETAYSTERAEEVRVLCDPKVRLALTEMGIELRSHSRARDGSRR